MKNKMVRITLSLVLILTMAFAAIPVSANDTIAYYGQFGSTGLVYNLGYEWSITVDSYMASSYGAYRPGNYGDVYIWVEANSSYYDGTEYGSNYFYILGYGVQAGVTFTDA